jgi:hypothetical protein
MELRPKMMMMMVTGHKVNRRQPGGDQWGREGKGKDTETGKDQNMIHVYVQSRLMKCTKIIEEEGEA